MDRILKKFDILMSDGEYDRAERMLLCFIEEYKNDIRKKYTFYNELIGFYRKTNNEEKCLQTIEKILLLIKNLNIDNTITCATGYINIATAYANFKKYEKAFIYFDKVKEIYEKNIDIDVLIANRNLDNNKNIIHEIASLYNNMINALSATKQYDKAFAYSKKAIELNKYVENGIIESAITYLNIANMVEARDGFLKGEKEINQYVEKASILLDDEKIEKNRYYVFVCEKCLEAFEYYGYFMYAKKLKKKINELRKNF